MFHSLHAATARYTALELLERSCGTRCDERGGARRWPAERPRRRRKHVLLRAWSER